MPRTRITALLLFGSGLCALIYQTVWMRQFRLVFGASTAASAAVLAIFMGGLGFGGIRLGRMAQRASNALRFYGLLELGVAILAALSPGLVEIIERIYLAVGGSSTLGLFGATIFRLLLSAFVLGLPAYLMGGTLPAAARYVETQSDRARHRAALLYGVNTLGAVTGVVVSTFYALEHFGNRNTLWLTCVINVVVAGTAIILAGRDREAAPEAAPEAPRRRPQWFVLVSAAVAGFAFLLMELVWYRMLTPLLGGTLFTFGLILAAALLGIGAGGIVYGWWARGRVATMTSFAAICAVEALLLVIPYALGDRIAVLALLLRALSPIGFSGYVIGWFVVALLVVFPASLASGVQFPMLIALLGEGDDNVAVDVGEVYAWNTIGAIAGSIGGGFGLLPLLTATGAWRLATVLLCIVSVAAIAIAVSRRSLTAAIVTPAAAVVAALICLLAQGPTAAWRHSPIGAGRADKAGGSRNEIVDWLHYQRRVVAWQEDGVESTVALTADMGYAFVVNGKIDGHARFDAPTQVMSGLMGALLHPDPKSALVVGLGTGSTAGWLGAVPSIDRVDVVELEPATIRIAEACTPVNHDVLHNQKVHLTIGDGREVLLTTRRSYDVIASEPSNPYRAGVATLYTTAFYRAVARKLRPHGLFLQWMQAYEIDSQTLRTIYSTYHATFPFVDTWETQWGDLLLIGSMEPVSYDANRLRARIQQEPFRTALAKIWRATDLEGVLAHFVGGHTTAELIAGTAPRNTDDRLLVEFAFARTLGTVGRLDVNDVKTVAKARHDDLPPFSGGSIDIGAVERRRLSMIVAIGGFPFMHPFLTPEMVARSDTSTAFMRQNYKQILGAWTSQKLGPEDPIEALTFADAEAEQASDNALLLLPMVRSAEPLEADIVIARLRWKQGRLDEAAAALERAFLAARHDPWPIRETMSRALEMASAIASQDPTRRIARRFYDLLSQPFSVRLVDQKRLEARALVAEVLDPGPGCSAVTIDAIRPFEPNVPWRREFLTRRAQCYRETGDPLAERAEADLQRFESTESVPLRNVVLK